MFAREMSAFAISKTAVGLSPRTVDWYVAFIRRYTAWAHEENLPMQKPDTVEAYLAHLRKSGKADATISGCYNSLKAYFKWLMKRRGLEDYPLAEIPAPTVPLKRVPHITLAEFRHLTASIPLDTWRDLRDVAILNVLLYSGLRASELLNLHKSDVDRTNKLLYVTAGKGDKDRDVPCTRDTLTKIDAYLDACPPHRYPHLFMSAKGHGVKGGMIYDGLKEMLRRRCAAANLPTYRPHKFRHANAMLLLNAGMPMSALAAMLGHSSVTVTERFYARWQTTSLVKVYSEATDQLNSEPNDS